MRHSETVTFGGGSLNRAANLRNDPAEMARLLAAATASYFVLWRGKLLFNDAVREMTLGRVSAGHLLLQHATDQAIFLGFENSAPVFASDISGWTPEATSEESATFFDKQQIRDPALPDNHWFGDLREVMALLTPLEAELAASAKAIFAWHENHRFCAKCGCASDMVMAGWQRQCPACKCHHFPRTDPVVIMLITRGNNVLLGRSPGWPEKMYSLLAGFVEPGETLEAAVRREVLEEVGVQVGPVGYLASQPWPFPASLMVGCHGEALTTKLVVDPVEIDDALWISRERLMAVRSAEDSQIMMPRHGSIAQFLLQNWLADRLD